MARQDLRVKSEASVRRAKALAEHAVLLAMEAREVLARCRNTRNVVVLQRTLARAIAKTRSPSGSYPSDR